VVKARQQGRVAFLFKSQENGFLIVLSCFQVVVSGIGSRPVIALTITLSVKSCPVGPQLHPSFDALSAPGCCQQSHEILVYQDMKYWDSGLNAEAPEHFIATVHKAAAVISWRHSGKTRRGQTQFIKFPAKLSFMPPWSLVYFFFLGCFLKSHPLCVQTGVTVPSFPEFTDEFNILNFLNPMLDSWVDWSRISNPAVP
jgi:hypothetical protein